MRASTWLKLLAPVLLLAGCADLETLADGACGNGVVEQDEDCDLFAAPDDGTSCIPAGNLNECHWQCDPVDSAPPCPDGWVCMANGLCVQHAGTFVESSATEVRASTRLSTGDLDGNGATDLLVAGPSLVDLVHVASDGTPATDLQLPVAPAGPVVGDVTADGVDDVVLGYGGLVVQRGDRSRKYGPVTYAPIAWPSDNGAGQVVIMDALPPRYDSETGATRYLGDEILWVGSDGVRTLEEDTLDWAGPDLGGVLTGLPPEVIVGDLWLRSSDSDCDELLVQARAESRSLWILSPCGLSLSGPSGDGYDLGARLDAPVRMPKSCAPDRGIVVTEVNGDGLPDVVLASSCPPPNGVEPAPSECGLADAASPDRSGLSLWIAYGQLDGTLAAIDGTLEGDPPLSPEGCEVVAVANPGLDILLQDAYETLAAQGVAEGAPILLGAADFNRDGLPDFVLRDGTIAMSSPGEPSSTDPAVRAAGYLALRYGDVRQWTAAHVSDFNGNGVPDVVAAVAGQERLLFLNGTPAGVLNKLDVPLLGVPKQMVVGDFDGDLLPDVAFAETGEPDVLSICYGQPFGAPTEPYRVGALGQVLAIQKGNLPWGGFDGLEDLVVTTRQSEAELPQLALLLGSYDGMPFSPLFFTRNALTTGGSDEPEINGTPMGVNPVYEVDLGFVATAVGVGNLDGDADDHLDVVALTAPGNRADASKWTGIADHHLWSFPLHGEAQVGIGEVRGVALDDTFGLLDPNLDASRALLAVVDLGGPLGPGGKPMAEVVGLATSVPNDDDVSSMTGTLVVAEADPNGLGDSVPLFRNVQTVSEPSLVFGGPPPRGLAYAEERSLPWETGGQVAVGDVTGDGYPDIVVLAGWVDLSKPEGQQTRTTLVAFPNEQVADLAVAIDPARRIDLWVQMPSLDVAPYGDPASFALWNVDADPELELFVSTAPLDSEDATSAESASRIYLVDPDPSGGQPRTTSLGDASVRPLRGGTALSAGDFNGDGLYDLALVRPVPGGTYGDLAILLGQPRQ